MSDNKEELPSKSSLKTTNSNKLIFEDEILIRQIFHGDEFLPQFMLDCLTILLILKTRDISHVVKIFKQHIAPSLVEKYKNTTILELDEHKSQATPHGLRLRLSTAFSDSLVATFTRTVKENLSRLPQFENAPKQIAGAINRLDLVLAAEYVNQCKSRLYAFVTQFMPEHASEEIKKINAYYQPLYDHIKYDYPPASPDDAVESRHLTAIFFTIFCSAAIFDNVVLGGEVSVNNVAIKVVEYLAITAVLMLLKFKYDRDSNLKQTRERTEKIIFDLTPQIVIKLRVNYGADTEEKPVYRGDGDRRHPLPTQAVGPDLLSGPSYSPRHFGSPAVRSDRGDRRPLAVIQPAISPQETFEVIIGGSKIRYNPASFNDSNAFPVRNSHTCKTFVSMSDELQEELRSRGMLARFMKNITQTKFARSQGDKGLKFLTFLHDGRNKKNLAIYEAKFIGSFMGDTRALGVALAKNVNNTEYQFIHLCVLCTNSHRPNQLYKDMTKLLNVINTKNSRASREENISESKFSLQ